MSMSTISRVNNTVGNTASLTGLINDDLKTSSVSIDQFPSVPSVFVDDNSNFVSRVSLPPSPGAGTLSQVPGFQSSVLTGSGLVKSSSTNLNSPVRLVSSPSPNASNSLSGMFTPIIGSPGGTPTILRTVPNVTMPIGGPSSNVLSSSSINSFSTASERLANDDIRTMLLNSNYRPINTILTKSSNGQSTGRFIKSVTPSGALVIIDTNVVGTIPVSNNDMETVEISTDQALNIPLESKTGALRCATGVCGVAFECSNGICTMIRDEENLMPKETQFVKVSQIGDEAAVIGSDPYAIPIVKLSEILENPMEVDRKVNMATNRILTASFNQCHNGINDISNELNRLNEEYAKLDNNLRASSSNVSSTIEELRGYNEKFYAINSTKPEEINKHKTVIRELETRYELYRELLRLCKLVGSNRSTILALNRNFIDINNIIRRDFGHLEGVILSPGGQPL